MSREEPSIRFKKDRTIYGKPIYTVSIRDGLYTNSINIAPKTLKKLRKKIKELDI